MLAAEGLTTAAEIVREALPRVEETGRDNWNGTTITYTVYLSVDAGAYAQLGGRREELDAQISERLRAAVRPHTGNWYTVSISPTIEPAPDWRERAGEVSQVTRRNIIDGLRIDAVAWAGRLEEVEFLERLFDLAKMPSTDSRFKTASADIWQHRVNNPLDWPDDWIFGDDRFGLIGVDACPHRRSCSPTSPFLAQIGCQ